MATISNISIPTPQLALPVLSKSADAPAVFKPAAAPTLPKPDAGEDIQAVAEQRRLETVVQAAKDIANIFVVSDRSFTIFKDATGQYITRFTSLRDGTVTYIPEPELLRKANTSPAVSLKV